MGALGYYFAGRMIDAAGLVSPEAIRFLPVPEDQRMGPAAGAISVQLVRSTYPDWVVTMPIFAQNSLLQSDWFRKYYKLEASVPLPKISSTPSTSSSSSADRIDGVHGVKRAPSGKLRQRQRRP